ncbi:hypothetical protein ACWCOW_38480 [Streptomyces sp. NPDC001939]
MIASVVIRAGERGQHHAQTKNVPAFEQGLRGLLSDESVAAIQQQLVQDLGCFGNLRDSCQTPT